MEFWILILTAWAFYGWVQSRIRRQKDDERFARVVEALNKLEPRLKDLHKLETRVHELESRLATAAPPTTAKQPVTPPPPSPEPKPVEPPISIKLPPSLEIPKPPAPAVPPTPPPPPIEPPAAKPSVPPPPFPTPVTLPAPTISYPSAPPRPTPPPISPPPQPPHLSAREATSQLEETLGKNWLNKLGIVALVIGISLFLAYKFPSLTNPEKSASVISSAS